MAKEHEPSVQASRGADGESYLAVTFTPEFDVNELTQPNPAETIFVLDCSGSMQGESMMQATAALELCLRSMSLGDTFNICRFGSTWELMSSEPLLYSQATLDKALAYVRQHRDLGGTELYPPLEAILTQPTRGEMVRQIILLTDGQVSNEPAIVELSRKYRKYNRIFSFGIGAASSAFLVKGIARATGGASEFITAGERIDDKVLRTFGRITSPPVTNISIDWDGCDVQTLAELPPVFDGDVLTVFGRAPSRMPRRVTLSCDTPMGAKSWCVDVPPPIEDAGVIATMWARRTIQSMEEVNNLAATRSRIGQPSREREMLIQLSKQFRLLCSLTTFIAVEHRSPMDRNSGRPALRKVPVALAAGWGGVELAGLADSGGVDTCDASVDFAPASAPMQRGFSRLRRAFGFATGPRAKRLMGTNMLFDDAKDTSPQAQEASLYEAKPRPTNPPAAGGSLHSGRYLGSFDRSVDRSVNDTQRILLDAGDPTSRPIEKLILGIMIRAFHAKASHVKIVQLDDHGEAYQTVNGREVLSDQIPQRLVSPVFRMLKQLARMNVAECTLSQSGTIEFPVLRHNIECVATTTLTARGESFVIEIVKIGPPKISPEDELKAILALQSAEGWFGWDRSHGKDDALDDAIARIGGNKTDWNKAAHEILPAMTGASWEPDRVARTGIAMVVLSSRAKDIAKRAKAKAMRYLSTAMATGLPETEAWLLQLQRKLGLP